MRAAAVAIVALLLAGCGGTADAWTQTRNAITVDPGGASRGEEVNLQLTSGDTIHWEWSSTGNLHFNVHAHKEGKTLELVVRDGMSSSGTYTAEFDGVFSFFWVNNGSQRVQLTYEIGGDGKKLG